MTTDTRKMKILMHIPCGYLSFATVAQMVSAMDIDHARNEAKQKSDIINFNLSH
jgi:hypothetical protein